MFHVQRFQPHTYIVIEGSGVLEMHLLLLYGFKGESVLTKQKHLFLMGIIPY